MHCNYQDLKVWRKSFDLTLKMYEVVSLLPPCESRNITDQLRRASTSITLNIAEGASCNSTKMFLSHLHYSYASGKELTVLLMLCLKLDYIKKNHFDSLYKELDIFLMSLYKFILNIEKKQFKDKLAFLK